jgi:hypothetical protein
MVSFGRVLEAVHGSGELDAMTWEHKPLMRSLVADVFRTGKLKGVSGIYALLSPPPDERMLFLGFSDDIDKDLRRHAEGRTSALLEMLVTQGAEETVIEVLPSPRGIAEQIYRTARRLLSDEFDIHLPLNPDK